MRSAGQGSLGQGSLADLPEPRTLRDMAAIALALEAEAQRRHLAFAEVVEAIAPPEVLALLARLAGQHGARHKRLESDWATGEGTGGAAELPKTLIAQVSAEEEEAVCDRYRLTPYKLLAFDVAAAQRRFTLYSYLAAGARDADLRNLAEGYAADELALAAKLREERRHAYRVERRKPTAEGYPSPALVASPADLVAAALFVERALGEHLEEAGQAHPALLASLEATRLQIDELQRRERDTARPGGALAEELAGLRRPLPGAASPDRTDAQRLRRLLADCERAFTFYDAVAGAAASAEVMLEAQVLSQLALERIKRVNEIWLSWAEHLPEDEPGRL